MQYLIHVIQGVAVSNIILLGTYIIFIYLFLFLFYVCIIFLHTNLPCFVKRPRAIVIDWALYKYFYYYYYYYYVTYLGHFRAIIVSIIVLVLPSSSNIVDFILPG